MKYITILVFIALFIACTGKISQQTTSKLPGSYASLIMMSKQRAYPNPDIPNHGIQKGYEKHKKLIEDSPSRNGEVEPWKAKGPLNTAGRILALAINPLNDSTVYAGSASGGLWRSRRLGLGLSWERVALGYPVLGVSSIAFAPADSMVMYIGTGETYNYENVGTGAAYRNTRGTYGMGILKSEDGGITWSKSLDWSYQQKRGVFSIQVSPSHPEIIYTGTTEGVYKSTDSGENWIQVHDVIMANDLVVHPQNPDWVVVGCGNFDSNGMGLYRTEDGGENWIKIGEPVPEMYSGKAQLDISPSNPDVIYASIGNGFIPFGSDNFTWLCRSDNAGIDWTLVNTSDYSRWQGWFAHDVAVNPDNPDHIMCVGIDIWSSVDGGMNLNQISSGGVTLGRPAIEEADGPEWYSHSDHHVALFHPSLNDIVLFANDGGVFLSMDNGASFQSVNGGLQTTQFYNGFSISHVNPNFAMGGLQDNSTSIFRGDGAWQRAVGGDGSWTAINQLDNNVVYASYQGLNVLKSYDMGFEFVEALNIKSNNDNALFIAPYIISISHPEIMFAGAGNIYKSEDGGSSWQISATRFQLGGDKIFAMDISSSNPDIVYAATAPQNARSQLIKTFNGGDSWEEVSENLPDRYINDIAIDPVDESIAYISYSGFGTGHIFKTTDAGDTWKDISVDLPDIPGNAIAIDPIYNDHIYFGNDIAVYFSSDGGVNWEVFSEGLTDAILIMDMKISPITRKIWLASHGNGVYTRDLIEPAVANDEISYINPRIRLKLIQNPLNETLKYSLSSSKRFEFFMRIIDMKGDIVWTENTARKGVQGYSEFNINLPYIPAGVYVLQLVTQEQNKSVKFVKI